MDSPLMAMMGDGWLGNIFRRNLKRGIMKASAKTSDTRKKEKNRCEFRTLAEIRPKRSARQGR
jgi:hypothetical protein